MPEVTGEESSETTTTTTEVVQSPDMTKYSKLMGEVEYDHVAAEQLAEAMNEIRDLLARAEQLTQIVKENKSIQKFVHVDSTGRAQALHDMDNEHIANLMMWCLREGRAINKGIRSEAMKRGITIPTRVRWDESTNRSVAQVSVPEHTLAAFYNRTNKPDWRV